jgi:hypothetical protein
MNRKETDSAKFNFVIDGVSDFLKALFSQTETLIEKIIPHDDDEENDIR